MAMAPPASTSERRPMTARRWAEAGVLLALGAGAAAWQALSERDARALADDPDWPLLERRIEGEPLEVRAPDGTRLAADLHGPEDAPPIVLIHGWTCARRYWNHQLLALRDRHRVIAYDLRGHGASEAPADGDFSTDALADDLQAVLDAALPDGRPALLVGHSLGAMSIVAWAGRHPQRVRERALGAALLNTGIGDLVSEALVVRTPSALGHVKAAVGSAILGARSQLLSATPISRRAVRYVALSRRASPAAVELSQQLLLECRREARAGAGRTLSQLDLTAAVAQLTVPTLVLASARDRLTPPVHAQRLAAALPQLTELVELEDAGHMGPLEAPQAVTAAIERLAAAVAAPARA